MTNENFTDELLLAGKRLSAVWNEPIASPTVLIFFDWSLTLRAEEVADITYRGVPVLRGLRVVVRDENWGTPVAVVTATRIESAESALRVRLVVSHRDGNVDFGWHGLLEITTDTLRFSFGGEAAETFLSNRIGIVVLHPPTLAGQVVTVTDPSGTETAVWFSQKISPHQPAQNIAGMSWKVAPRRPTSASKCSGQRSFRVWPSANYASNSSAARGHISPSSIATMSDCLRR